ncbi:hypothetical protein GCM10009771_01070 [Nesterenkonia flava]
MLSGQVHGFLTRCEGFGDFRLSRQQGRLRLHQVLTKHAHEHILRAPSSELKCNAFDLPAAIRGSKAGARHT